MSVNGVEIAVARRERGVELAKLCETLLDSCLSELHFLTLAYHILLLLNTA